MDVQVWSDTTLTEILLLGLAVLLCGAVGLERQVSQKSAGLRTHTLVGMGSAGFTLVSAYGFDSAGQTGYDPSRIAAQVVSGIGFLGAGVIFMRRDVVRGLTTAATIWVSAAIGMACGAGMVVLAVAMTGFQLLAVLVLAPLGRLVPSAGGRRTVDIRYRDGHGVLRELLRRSTEMGFQAAVLSTRQLGVGDGAGAGRDVTVSVEFRGRVPVTVLVEQLSELDGVEEIRVRGRQDDWD